MRCALFGRAPPLVVNLSGGDVAVAEELLNLPDVDAGIQEQGGGGRARAENRCCRAAHLP